MISCSHWGMFESHRKAWRGGLWYPERDGQGWILVDILSIWPEQDGA